MNFTKMQGAGNDFILVEANESDQNWSRMAVAMCNRHFGIGADGLLVLLPPSSADFKMRIFNPDGSEAEACGNGLRCLVRYVIDRELAKSEVQEISVETVAGIRKAKISRVKRNSTEIQVGMGEPKFGAKDIPVVIEPEEGSLVDIKSLLSSHISIGSRELLLHFVSMGNPHAIYFWQYPVSDFPLSQLGPEVEKHNMFPSRVNFEVAHALSRQQIETRVWERGVGETLACGSGACAVAVAAQLLGYVGNRIDIKLSGGTLGVEWDGAGEVLLGGPAEIVFTGEWSG
ncbi:diaminopimelate epimerase [Chloroflexota bacterium]